MVPTKLIVVGGALVILTLVVSIIVAGESVGWPFSDESAAQATPEGDRPNPFGRTTEPTDEGEATDAPSRTINPDAPASPDAGEAPVLPADCPLDLAFGEVVPLFAVGEVAGLGQPATYVVYESCGGPAWYQHYERRRFVPPATVAVDGGCLFASTWLPDLAATIVDRYEGGAGALLDPLPVVFQASFVTSPLESLSISHDVVDDVIAGGYKYGGTGRRGEGEQWGLSGAGTVEYSIPSGLSEGWYLDESDYPWLDGPLSMLYVPIRASWAGESVENWTGAEAAGRVDVTCAQLIRITECELYELEAEYVTVPDWEEDLRTWEEVGSRCDAA
jgi:hypothetical protein